ncbi:MAG TPA: AsmA-like C-terminal region-containing protein [Candidatus Acidoferrales bacterium]|nr:AsmA-like C-terminal region-containing protein [Candidatus Acidoferrales bacterium]
MRKWMILGGVVLVLIVVAGFAVANLNSLINRNKDYLIAQAEAALGRKISVGDIGLTLWGGIGARFKKFSLADDPSFSNEPFVRAADLQINMKLWPLLRKEFEISKVILHRPVITVIRDHRGQYNFSTLGRDKEKREPRKETDREKRDRRAERGAAPGLIVSLVDVDDGAVHYIDKRRGLDLRVTQLDFRIKDAGFDRPVELALEAAILGAAKQNLKVAGRVRPLAGQADGNLSVEGDVELQPVPLAALETALPRLHERILRGLDLAGSLGVKARVSGAFGNGALPAVRGTLQLQSIRARVPQLAAPITDLNANIKFTGQTADLPETSFRIGKSQLRLAATAATLNPLHLTYRLGSPELHLADLRAPAAGKKRPEILRDLKGEGTVALKNGAVTQRGSLSSPSGTIADAEYRDLRATTSFAGNVLTIESLSFGAFDGSMAASGRYDMREATPRFAITTNVKAMNLTEISRALFPSAPQNIAGRINMDLDVTGFGKEWPAIQKTLKGKGRAEVIDGLLRDVNLAESVLSNTGVPGAINLIPADIRRKYPNVFSSKDTEFKQLKGSATISDGRAYTDDLVVAAAEFESTGKGWFAFDRTVDFRGVLLFSQALSQDITSRTPATRGLANESGRIEIPFTLSGRLPGAKPRPDIGYIARAMQKGAVEQGFEQLFRRRSRRGAAEAPLQQEPPSGSQERRRRDPVEEIRRGLEGLFGGR